MDLTEYFVLGWQSVRPSGVPDAFRHSDRCHETLKERLFAALHWMYAGNSEPAPPTEAPYNRR